jgi:hypothetical protein
MPMAPASGWLERVNGSDQKVVAIRFHLSRECANIHNPGSLLPMANWGWHSTLCPACTEDATDGPA